MSGPRRRTEMSTPEKEVGACVRLTVSTEPGRTRSGCDFEKRVPMSVCFSVDGSVCWRYAIRPLPWRRAGGGDPAGGGGIIATWEYGYGLVDVESNRDDAALQAPPALSNELANMTALTVYGSSCCDTVLGRGIKFMSRDRRSGGK